MLKPTYTYDTLGPESICAAANQLSCANLALYNWAHTRTRKKGCFTTFRDASPTVLAALTELGESAGPSVEVVKGCEELLCSLFCSKQLHITLTKTMRTRSRSEQTPNYSECLVIAPIRRAHAGAIYIHTQILSHYHHLHQAQL